MDDLAHILAKFAVPEAERAEVVQIVQIAYGDIVTA